MSQILNFRHVLNLKELTFSKSFFDFRYEHFHYNNIAEYYEQKNNNII